MHDDTTRGDGLLHQPVIDSAEALAANAWAQECATLPAERIDIERMKIPQRWERYTEENHRVWGTIFEKRMAQLGRDGSRVFLDGAEAIRLTADAVPRLDVVNAQLSALTGWQSFGVPGYLPPKCFFAWLAQRQFPTTISVRPADQMAYLPEPDIIHDVFGHVPLHTDPQFADFLQTYGKAALVTDDPVHTERLARLFWFTVEFGLIHEDGRLKLYGSGLISSEGEGHHALYSSEVERRPFDLEQVCDTAFEIHHYQPILYVLESFEQLARAMRTYADRLLELASGPAAA
ncbi:MAG: phenylalanine 4-monooxygenase [Deltaproteobacteria bacterium]|nr:MAG: phenylalanine 4-monooxygenase [Deltaproteobacteria bacterium]